MMPMIRMTTNKVWPRPIPAASRSLAKPRRGIRRGNGANFVVKESAPPTLVCRCGFIPEAKLRGILRSHNKNTLRSCAGSFVRPVCVRTRTGRPAG